MRSRVSLSWLRSWPLLIAAVIAFSAGTRLLGDAAARELAAAALLAVGAVCLGAWIALLAAHGSTGIETWEDAEQQRKDKSDDDAAD